MARRFTEEEALKILQELEPEYKFKFIYKYKNIRTRNLKITCNHNHQYVTTYSNFVIGKRRCKECGYNKKTLTEHEALKILHELEPNYSFYFKDGYKNSRTKNLHITCNNNHKYISTYGSFVNNKRRCPHCYGKVKLTEQEALNNLKEMQSDYTFKFEGGYINALTKNLHICCNFNHSYVTKYNHFQRGVRCPYCVNQKSKPETEIIDYIKTFYNKDIEQSNRKLIKNKHSGYYLELDIYLPDIKLAIEFNGKYYHTNDNIKSTRIGFNSSQEYHEYKSKQCQDIGVHLIHIDEEHYLEDKTTILQSIKETIQQHINPNINLS